jgi:hypothetical protein
VSATDASAGEPANNGTFTFTRSGGTASSGADYTDIGTLVTIADGRASATRTVTVIDDAPQRHG